MSRKYKLVILAVGLAVILIAGLATTALAAQKARTAAAAPTNADYQAWGCPMLNGNYQAVSDLVGMTTQEIQAELQQGKSLVEIAAAKGVTEDQLVAAIIEPMKTFMQGQVTSGFWTQEQVDARLKLAEQHIRLFINASGNSTGYGWGMMGNGYNIMGGNYGGMMGGWGTNNGTSGTGAFRGGMMGGNYGGMMGGRGTNSGGSFGRGGMMGGWY